MKLFLKKRLWIAVVLVLTLILIVRAIPAAWMVYFIQQSAPGFKVQGVSGTLWQGEIKNSVFEQRGGTLPIGQVDWSLSPWSLLTFSPCIDLNARAGAQNLAGEACVGMFSQAVTLNDMTLNLPLANISPLLELDVRGNVSGQVNRLRWNGKSFDAADFRALWNGAQINNGSQFIALGDINARSNATENGDLNVRWSSAPNGEPPVLNVQLTTLLTDLAAAPRVKVDGTVGVTSQTRGLRPMLQFIGSETSTNTFRVSMNEPL